MNSEEAPYKKLKRLIENLHRDNRVREYRLGISALFRSNEFGSLNLNYDQASEYFSILDQFAPDNGAPSTRSRAEADNAIAQCIISALATNTENNLNNERIDQSLDALKKRLNSTLVLWEIWGIVDRIRLSTDEFRFGKVLFCKTCHESAKSLLQKFETKNPLLFIEDIWHKDLDKKTLCRIDIMAGDKEAAIRLGEFELETTLVVLNFFASFFYLSDRLPSLSSRRHSSNVKDGRIYFEQGSNGWTQQFSAPRYYDQFDQAIIRRDPEIELAFNKISKFLESPKTQLSERFLGSIKWAGKGSVTENRENAFIFYAIALESLLLGSNRHEQLSLTLRLRAAHLLGFTNTARAEICKTVSRLYGLRSKIVHSGRTEIPETDLAQLRIITQSCIIRLLTGPIFCEFSTEKALEDWFDEMILYGPENQKS